MQFCLHLRTVRVLALASSITVASVKVICPRAKLAVLIAQLEHSDFLMQFEPV